MPELFSHCTLPCATVQQVVMHGIDNFLVPRLTVAAARQKQKLAGILAATHLSPVSDQRSLPLCGAKDGKMKNSRLYKLSTMGGVLSRHHDFIWESRAPSRVKFFAWLLVHGRIQCRSNLLRKSIITPEESGCPICSAPLETPEHIMLSCPFARRFWLSLGCTPGPSIELQDIDACPVPASAPLRTASTLRLLCCWHLWKHRNGVVFDGLAPSLALLRKRCREDAVLWRARLPHDHQCDVDLWLTYLLPVRY